MAAAPRRLLALAGWLGAAALCAPALAAPGSSGADAPEPAAAQSDAADRGAEPSVTQSSSAAEPTDGPEPGAAAPHIEVEVRANRPSPIAGRRDPTIATYVVSREALREPGLSLADVLARVPGVQTTRTGSDSDMATAAVRGASSAQTPVYLAGIRLNDDLTGTVDLSTVPLWMMDRVEIYRGHSPSGTDRYGIGGAILLEPTLPSGRRVGAGLGVGTLGWREAHVAVAMGSPKAGALFAMRRESAQNDFEFVNDQGTRFDERDDVTERRRNGDSATLDAWGIGRIALGSSGGLTAVANGYEREAGVPGLELVGARHARSDTRRMLAGLSAHVPCRAARAGGDAEAQCGLEVSTGALLTGYRLHDPERELGLGRELDNAGTRVSQRLAGHAAVLDWLELRWGGLEELERLRVNVDQAQTLRAWREVTRLELGAAAHAADAFEAVASGALECHSTGTNGSLDGCGALEPLGRVGVRWRPAEPVALFANVGRYARVPTLGELYGTSSVVAGNPELKVEQGITTDLGANGVYDGDWVTVYGQLAGFARWASDLIGYRRSSFGVVRPYNTSRARVLGLELATGIGLWDAVEVGLALTALDPRDTSDDRLVVNDLLPLQARLAAAPYLELRTPSGWPAMALDRASLTLRYTYRSSRLADPAGLIVLDAQGELGLEAALVFLHGMLAVRGALANMLNDQSVDLVGYPLPGRTAHLAVEAWW